MSEENKIADSATDNALWIAGLCQTKAEQKMFDAIMKYAKEQNVNVCRSLCQPLTKFKTNSPSFYDIDRKEMYRKFGEIGSDFIEKASKEFIDSRISDTIKINHLKITIERGFNIPFNPNNVKDLIPKPYAQFVLTIYCWEMEGFEPDESK